MTFTGELWAAGEPAYAAIRAHPFLAGLTDGTLPRESFRYYVVQDAHYLRDYARALALCSARAPEEAAVAMFAGHARDALAVERTLHEGLLAGLGAGNAAGGGPGAGEPDDGVGPATLAYTSYLLATCATGSYPAALGAVLPCYWIYREVGLSLLARSSPDPLYRRWIETYADPQFAAVVQAVLDHADAAGAAWSAAERAGALTAFAVTARYEWMFWDAAWRGLTWPLT